MGTKGREIVGGHLDQVLDLLSRAFSDEWLAYYQYWIGAKVAVGRMRGIIAEELAEHAGDELKHAGMLVERIRFKTFLGISVLWTLFVYAPIVHWVWGGGFLSDLGVMDYAGGLVIHMTAGFSALVD